MGQAFATRRLLAAALACTLLLAGLFVHRLQGSGAQGGARAAARVEQRGTAELDVVPGLPSPDQTGKDAGTPARQAIASTIASTVAATASLSTDAWHFRIRTALKSRRPEGHAFVIIAPSIDGAAPRVLFEGSTNGRGRADVAWTPSADLAAVDEFVCRVTDDGCAPHQVSFEPLDIDELKRAKAFMSPEAYTGRGVLAVDSAGSPVPCTFWLVLDGRRDERLSALEPGYVVVPERFVGALGLLHASSEEHGTGSIPLAKIETGGIEPHRLLLRSHGGATGTLYTTGGSPLAGATLSLQRIHEKESRDSNDPGRSRSALGRNEYGRTAGDLRINGEGLTSDTVQTDEHGRFDAPLLCPGDFNAYIALGRRGVVPAGTVVSAASGPAASLVVPYAWVSLEGDLGENQIVLFDTTDGGSVESERGSNHPGITERSVVFKDREGRMFDRIDGILVERGTTLGETPGSADRPKKAPRVRIGQERRVLLKTGRSYAAVLIDPGDQTRQAVRRIDFDVPDITGPLTVRVD